MTVTLRRAEPRDLEAVISVFLRCWRGTYASWMPPAVVESMSDEQAKAMWQQAFSRPGWEVVVAEVDGRVCGLVAVGADRADGAVGWVYSLYVDPTAQGSGVGSALIGHAAGRLADLGFRDGRLWVFAANAPSIRFYARNGWLPDGSERVEEPYGENVIGLTRLLADGIRRPA